MLTPALMIVSGSVVKAIVNNRAVIIGWDCREGGKLRLFVKVGLVGFAFNLVTSPLYFLTYSLILPSCTLSSSILSWASCN
jgi:hypothetical protein